MALTTGASRTGETFEVTGDRPLIWAAWTGIADAQGMDDEFHPRKDEES